jgi:pilus assembly protein CpaF
MVLMSDVEIPSKVIQQQVVSAIKMVVQVSRLQDGSRKIIAVSEVRGIKDGHVDVHDIFFFERTGVTADGKVQGRFRWSGEEPKILQRVRVAGIPLDESVFHEVLPVNL